MGFVWFLAWIGSPIAKCAKFDGSTHLLSAQWLCRGFHCRPWRGSHVPGRHPHGMHAKARNSKPKSLQNGAAEGVPRATEQLRDARSSFDAIICGNSYEMNDNLKCTRILGEDLAIITTFLYYLITITNISKKLKEENQGTKGSTSWKDENDSLTPNPIVHDNS